jgi:hypothetical protein
MARWSTTLRIVGNEMKLLVTSPLGDDLLKARLPIRPLHPRALLTLLEGVALWSGEPVRAVMTAGAHHDDRAGSDAWGDDLWPFESPLVRFDFARSPSRTRRRLVGVGDFRDVRLVWTK